MPRTQQTPQPHGQRAADQLVPAVARELGSALASLRAALEGIAREFDEGDPRQERVRLAVVQTIPIARQVEALADCTDCSPLHEISCTMEEIGSSVRNALHGYACPPLRLALEDADIGFRVDGPLLVRALAHFAEELVHSGDGDLLLRARLQRGTPSFSLLWRARSSESELLALQRQLLKHEARRLGARFEESQEACGLARVELRFPAASLQQEEAA